jgi:hypothetical protein
MKRVIFMKANAKNNKSAIKKLLPAIAMLTTSAIMLSTATYAWFTMNKEVDVEGLTMSATTSDSLEISLGCYDATKTDGSQNVTIAQPGKDDYSWSRKITFGEYYSTIGKLKPASTATALTLYKADEGEIKAGGRVVDDDALIYSVIGQNTNEGGNVAAQLLARSVYNATGALKQVSDGGIDVAADATKNITEKKYTSTDESNASGYYIDVPMWIRSSSLTGHKIKCTVTITDPNTDNGSDLINAVRVAIIPTGDATSSAQTTADIANGATSTTSSNITAALASAEKAGLGTNNAEGVSIFALKVTSDDTSATDINPSTVEKSYYNGLVLGKSGIESGTTVFKNATTGFPTTVAANPTSVSSVNWSELSSDYKTNVFVIPNATKDDYAVQAFVVRVWIEGQSVHCNDSTANQDWNIDLHFELGDAITTSSTDNSNNTEQNTDAGDQTNKVEETSEGET